MSTEAKEKSLAVEARETALKGLITNHAVNNEAAQDLFNSLSLDAFEVNGIEKVIVRDAGGNILLSDNDILEHLKETRPSYLSKNAGNAVGNAANSQANDINAAHQLEKNNLHQQVVDAAQSGDFELYVKLRKKQGAKYHG